MLAVGGFVRLPTCGGRTAHARISQRVRTAAPQDAVGGSAAAAPQQRSRERQNGGTGRAWQSYPYIDRFFPGLEQVRHNGASVWLCAFSKVWCKSKGLSK